MLRLYGSERQDITEEPDVFCGDPDWTANLYSVKFVTPAILILLLTAATAFLYYNISLQPFRSLLFASRNSIPLLSCNKKK